MLQLRYPLTAGILSVLVAATATAGSLSDLFVFGDSLSDIGNITQATFGSQPGPYYYDGRVTNGPVYAEVLAAELGLTLTHSRAGGNNFAHAAALTSGTGGLSSLFVQDIDDQVDAFDGNRTVDPDALFIVFAGANDLIGGQTDVNVPVGNLLSDMGRLVAADARQLLVMNLPYLGLVPRFNSDPTAAAEMTQATIQFNTALDAALDGFETSHPELTLFRLDVARLFNDVIADPTAFGLSNVTDPAAPGLSPGDSAYDTGQIVDDPSTYLFWDDLHPTSTVHALLGQYAFDAVVMVGDYNGDRLVNAADYTVWRDNLNSTSDLRADGNYDGIVDLADYDLWKLNFGRPTASIATDNVIVPEPAGTWSIAIFLAITVVSCRSTSSKDIR